MASNGMFQYQEAKIRTFVNVMLLLKKYSPCVWWPIRLPPIRGKENSLSRYLGFYVSDKQLNCFNSKHPLTNFNVKFRFVLVAVKQVSICS